MHQIDLFLPLSSQVGLWRHLLRELDRRRGPVTTVWHFDSINVPTNLVDWRDGDTRLRDFVRVNRTYDVTGVLRRRRPDTVVVLDNGSLVMRAVLLAANRLGIPSVHTQHGLLPELPLHADAGRRELSAQIGGKLTVATLLRNWRKIALTYGTYALAYSKNSPRFPFDRDFMKYSYHVFRDPKLHNLYWRDEVHATEAFCYTPRDKDHFVRVYGYQPHRVRVVGNPEFAEVVRLAEACREPRTADLVRQRTYETLGITPGTSEKFVLLVSQPIAEDGLIRGWNIDRKVKHIKQLYESLRSVGCRLVVKLHPREDEQRLREYLRQPSDLILVRGADLYELIFCSDFVLGYYSTALIGAVLLGKRPLILRWVVGDRHTGFPDLRGCHVATDVLSLDDLPSHVRTPQRTLRNEVEYRRFVQEYVGLGGNEPPERLIVNAILNSR